MYCWQARQQFADWIDQGAAPPRARRVGAHLASCASCRLEVERLSDVARLVGESAWPRRADAPEAESRGIWAPAELERRLLREIRARAASARPQPRPRLLFTAPAAAAVLLMLGASAAAHYLSGSSSLSVSRPDSATVSNPTDLRLASDARRPPQDDLRDDLAVREVPFTVQEDLVGARRGRIPLTTYVLEPAPEPARVLRASL